VKPSNQLDSSAIELSLTLSLKSITLSDSSNSRDSPQDQPLTTSKLLPIKPPCRFIPLEQEVCKGVNKGITPLNIIKGKCNYKVVFMIEQLF
jgi:hypothetical protein